MNCIIIDDEPLAREAIEMLVNQKDNLHLVGSFNSAESAALFMTTHPVELIFLDIQMPGINGLEFARTIPEETFVIFTTAYAEFASDSYEVDAVDYLIKPVKSARFLKAVEKAFTYSKLFKADYNRNKIEQIAEDFLFVKAERRIFKVYFKNILFIQGLKDYVVMHNDQQKLITAMNLKTIYDQLPKDMFVRVSKSYVINVQHIGSVDNNTVYIGANEIPIGGIYRDYFFNEFVTKKMIGR
ncbi:two component transcriptional regulator, LytTR family [Chitinophaga jiangningensis]|uniref:Two component transcriptional regulator, LytTR family n=1 Tax=Chitinophaga jiangningensis TaxID=1419482 RepID=A0A1M7A1L6_9BACT|nr:LytTR family DNA-binding domain-containing protein [Chitinophaga jiangningensis]SHL36509.1 two component transcriptional regulator, LytTR family [Chitinophaga jiangningensis]